MIKGRLNNQKMTVDELMSLTNGGFDIFALYLGKVSRVMSRPWGKRELHMSWSIFPRGNVFFWKDHATEENGNAIHFVQKYFNLTFYEAFTKIVSDFNLENKGEIKKIVTWDPPDKTEEYTHISFTECPFNDRHAKYWNDYHLSEDYLKRHNIFRVKTLAIRRKIVRLNKDELTFAYYNEPTDSVKILRIGVDPNKKWRTNASGDTLWLKEFLRSNEKLVISKSVKDSLCLSLFGINSVAVQSENISCIKNNQDWLKGVTSPIIAFGTDEQGKTQSRLITKTYGYKHYNVPDNLLKSNINDIAEWCKHDISDLETHLRKKNLI